MDIGRMKQRIFFCKWETKVNELQQEEQELVKIKRVWASVEPMRGREYQEAQRIRPELTYKITTRYHKELTSDMFIQYQKREFQIISVINVKEKNEMLEIICIEKQKEKQKEGEKTEWIKF